jgi:hypothetical protein
MRVICGWDAESVASAAVKEAASVLSSWRTTSELPAAVGLLRKALVLADAGELLRTVAMTVVFGRSRRAAERASPIPVRCVSDFV